MERSNGDESIGPRRQAMSRRCLLRTGGVTLAGIGVAGCQSPFAEPADDSTDTSTTPSAAHGELLGRRSLDDGSSGEQRRHRELAVTSDTIYALDDLLQAVRRVDGTVRWQLDLSSVPDDTPDRIRTHRGNPYLVADDEVYGVDTDGPDIGWRFSPGPEITTTYRIRTEFVGTADGTLVLAGGGSGGWVTSGVDARSGHERWRVDDISSDFSAIIGEGTVLLLENDTTTALSVENGGIRWTVDDRIENPAIADGTVYSVGGESSSAVTTHYLIARDLGDGTRRWTGDLGRTGTHIHGTAPMDDSVLVIGSGNGEILASFDAESGRRRWAHRFEEDLGGMSPDHVVDETAYIMTHRNTEGPPREFTLHAIGLSSGERRWKRSFADASVSIGGVTPETVLLLKTDSEPAEREAGAYWTIALDAETGEERWRVDRTRLNVNPASGRIDDGVLYAVDLNGDVFALRL